MNRNQIKKALQEVESILQKSKETTVFAFINETEDQEVFHIKEIIYYKNGKSEEKEFSVRACNIEAASEMYHKNYVPEGCQEPMVFIEDIAE